MQVLQVGELYNAERTSWNEGYQYNFDEAGHVLLLVVSNLKPYEVNAVWQEDPVKFWLVIDGDLILLCWSFSDVLFGESPYSWHMAQTERPPDLDFEPGSGAALQIHLVEATNGRIAALRLVSFSREFTLKLHQAIIDQSRRPFDQKDYDARLARLYARYNSKQLRRLAIARYTVGQIHEVPLFELGQLVYTPGAEEALDRNDVDALSLFNRHRFGDFGRIGNYHDAQLTQEEWDTGAFEDEDTHDLKANAFAIHEGLRVMSVYDLPDGTTVWCITNGTEACRRCFFRKNTDDTEARHDTGRTL